MAVVDNGQELEIEIQRVLKMYDEEVRKEIRQASIDVARKGAQRLQDTSPKKTGEYASGWDYRESTKDTVEIYNSTKPQLTHLLEKGHVSKNGAGGPYGTRVKARPHIAKVDKEVSEMFKSKVEEILR